MREAERIADQLKRAYEGEAWHGPSLMEVLEGVTPESAAARPVNGAHSIWEIVSHIHAGREIVRRRLEGDTEMARETTESDWWPRLSDTRRGSMGRSARGFRDEQPCSPERDFQTRRRAPVRTRSGKYVHRVRHAARARPARSLSRGTDCATEKILKDFYACLMKVSRESVSLVT